MVLFKQTPLTMLKYPIKRLPQDRTELAAKVQKGKATLKTVQKAYFMRASDETVGRQSEADSTITYCLSRRGVARFAETFANRAWPSLSRHNGSRAQPKTYR